MLTSGSVEVTWDELSDAIGYLILCTTTASYAGGKNVIVNGGDTTRQTLTNLVENTPYDIIVQGIGEDGGKSPCSDMMSVKTSTPGKWYMVNWVSFIKQTPISNVHMRSIVKSHRICTYSINLKAIYVQINIVTNT